MNIVITKKKIKNIIIKIKPNGEVHISAPLRVSEKYLKELIEKKREWIEKKLLLVTQNKKTSFDSGESFVYLGFKYPIEVKLSDKEYCFLSKEKFSIYLKENTLVNRKKLVDRWIRENFYSYMIKRTMELGKVMGYTPTQIKFRDMKTRWGSCNTLTRSITFNHQLYKKQLEVVDYVIIHELAHIPFPHHQKEFWNFVENFMPNWKEVRKKLKEYI